MIKKVTTEDEMGRISEIWLESNIETHDLLLLIIGKVIWLK
ncbi:hypothetical protein [Enterococcus rivorum]